jgi:hypothetical protein
MAEPLVLLAVSPPRGRQWRDVGRALDSLVDGFGLELEKDTMLHSTTALHPSTNVPSLVDEVRYHPRY